MRERKENLKKMKGRLKERITVAIATTFYPHIWGKEGSMWPHKDYRF
jgi:hypothetical protein